MVLHRYILGQSQDLLLQLFHQDISKGFSAFYLDPHGHDIDRIVSTLPEERAKDVVLFDCSRSDVSPGVDLLAATEPALLAKNLIRSIKDAYRMSDVNTPRIDRALFNSLVPLIEHSQPFLGVMPYFYSKAYRDAYPAKNLLIRQFWANYDTLKPNDKLMLTESSLSKLGPLFVDPYIADVFALKRNSFQMRGVLEGKILLVKLPQGTLSIETVRIIGTLLLTQLHLAALNRTSQTPFSIFLAEAHHVAGGTMRELFAAIGRQNVSITAAHQDLSQMPDGVLKSILANAQERYIFQVSLEDSQRLEHHSIVVQGTEPLHTLEPGRYRYFGPGSTAKRDYRNLQKTSYPQTDARLSTRGYRSRRKLATERDKFLGRL